MPLQQCYVWDSANLQWNSNPFIWDELCLSESCYAWDFANIQWDNNDFTWDNPCIIIVHDTCSTWDFAETIWNNNPYTWDEPCVDHRRRFGPDRFYVIVHPSISFLQKRILIVVNPEPLVFTR